MQRLKKIVHRRRPSSDDDHVTLSLPKTQLHALADTVGVAPSKSAVLLKYTNVLKRWKYRKFTLENGLLVYSTLPEGHPDASIDDDRAERKKKKKRIHRLRRAASKDDKESDVRGTINLQFAVICPDDSDDTRFAIDVGNEVYHIRAHTQQQRDEWVDVLKSSNLYFKALIQKAVLRAKHAPHPDVQPSLAEKVSSSTTDKSYDSEESVLEDDGLKEAQASRNAIIAELRRVLSHCRSKWVVDGQLPTTEHTFVTTLAEVFTDNNIDDDNQSITEVAKGLLDLFTWCLNTIETNDDLFNKKLKASVAHALDSHFGNFADTHALQSSARNSQGDHPQDDDDADDEDDDDTLFLDALSRAASRRSATEITVQDLNEINGLPVMDTADFETVRRVSTVRLSRGYSAIRTALPPLQEGKEKPNVFGFLKDSIGKDISKISMPISLNEPISFLQRLAEDIEYSELLDQAAAEEDPERRLMYVAAMIVSHYSSTQGRLGKPFNPLLGETASLVMPEKGNGLRFIAEQVSHHPPVSACYAEGSGASWKYYNSVEVKNKFWGKSLEVFPCGLHHIEIPKYGDHYVFEQVTSCVHNIVVGHMWLDNYGEMEIVNRTNGGRCVVSFVKTGWLSDSKSFATVKGKVFDASGKLKIKMSGNWTTALYEDVGKGKRKLIWAVEKRPDQSASQSYNMTKWAISLNSPVKDEEREVVAPTDSRLRPDQRALENGQYELATKYKVALEEGQRERRRVMDEAGEKWEPVWFKKEVDPVSGREDYRYKGGFFEKQADADWSQSPDIFSCAFSDPESSKREL